MNNQQDIPPSRNIPKFPEAFHQSLFDLQVLTWIFMEESTDAHYTLGARIMTLMATASTDEENKLLQFALQHLHSMCPPFDSNIIVTLCRDKLLNFSMCKHSLIFLNKGTINFGTIGPTTLLVKKAALNTQPSWLGVCVYLLKRSKTCILPCLFFLHEEQDCTSLHFISSRRFFT